MHVLYNILLLIAALLALPYYALKMILTGKYRKSLGPKFGFTGPEIFKEMKGSPRIWIHAVSVGEVTAAAPVVASLKTHFPEGLSPLHLLYITPLISPGSSERLSVL
jgi:3-deoxy-D-manno-octulosonic-acid transferase